jgi:signal transduction histidine kinase
VADIGQILPSRESINSWLTEQLAGRPHHTRRFSILIVAVTIAIIGWRDHSSDALVSYKFFYLLPIVMAVAWLGFRAGCVAAIMSLAVRSIGDLIINPQRTSFISFWNWLTDLLVYLVVVWALHGLISIYREVDRRIERRTRELQETNRACRQLERELLEVASRERSTLGEEIHDDLCQQLVGTAFATKVLAEALATRDPEAANRAQAIVNHIEDSISTARRLAHGLLHERISPTELPDALAALAAGSNRDGLSCRFRLEGDPAIPDATTAGQLLRIAQEALRNALRHAKPTRVEIVLGGTREAAFLINKDNGCGMPPKGSRGNGMGIRIMEQRASQIGGILSIVPAAGKGTSVICQLPRTPAGTP